MSIISWLDEFNALTALLLVLAAWRWGDAPERFSVAALLSMLVTDEYYHLLFGPATVYESVDLGHLLIDLGGAFQFVAIALYANRTFPLCLAAFQILSVIAHFARLELNDIGLFAYALLNYGPYYFEIAVILLGIALHARRKARFGDYPSWRA